MKGYNFKINSNQIKSVLFSFDLGDAFESQKDRIEATFGNPLEWERLTDKRMIRIKYKLTEVSVFNEEDWQKMFTIMVEQVPKFVSAFKNPIQL